MAGPTAFLLVENPSKGNNLGPIFRCASAFAVDQVVLVGYEKFSAEGSHGAARHVKTKAFPSFDQAVRYLRLDCKCVSITGILGGAECYNPEGCDVREANDDMVEINDGSIGAAALAMTRESAREYPRSKPVFVRPFRGNTAFVIAKRRGGLPIDHGRICDSFLHCSVLNDRTEPSKIRHVVDVPSVLSIVLHHFAAWAKYGESHYEGQKFHVAKMRKGYDDNAEEKRAKRAEARVIAARDAEEALAEGACGSLFDDEREVEQQTNKGGADAEILAVGTGNDIGSC